MNWDEIFNDVPLIAILRGLTVAEAAPIGEALVAAGFRCAEVTLNSPEPLACIGILQREFGDRLLIGAGTVLTEIDVAQVADHGGRIIISPHADSSVIRATKRRGLISFPAFFTPTEAIAALREGADALKLFPAEATGPQGLKALRAVLPATVPIFPVGGVGAASMRFWRAAGASGFGIGGSLYSPGLPPRAVRERARALVHAWRESAASQHSRT